MISYIPLAHLTHHLFHICKISFVIAIKILFAADGFNENVRGDRLQASGKGYFFLLLLAAGSHLDKPGPFGWPRVELTGATAGHP